MPDNTTAKTYRLEGWKRVDDNLTNEKVQHPCEDLPHGTAFNRKHWNTFNRARSGHGKTKDKLYKWGLVDSPNCTCGSLQNMDHIITSCPLGPTCTNADLAETSEAAKEWVSFWGDTI